MKASRTLLALALVSGMTAVVAAQDRGPGDKQNKDQADQKKDPIVRVARDLQTAEERLRNSDPGDLTRKIQRDIIDGLNELIKQNEKSESSQSQSSKMKKQSSDPKDSSSKDKLQTAKQNKGSKDNDPDMGKKNEPKKDDQKKSGGGKDDPKEKKDNPGKNDDSKKDPGKNAGIGTKGEEKKDKTDLTSELYRTEWGHLPLTKRLEMDAYSKERFMPRYDEVLQQYYRTIAEQGKGK